MNRFHIALAVAVAIFLTALAGRPAFADDTKEQGWYVGGSLGGVFAGGLRDKPFTVGSNGTTASADQGFSLGTGWSGGAQGGYQFGTTRLEGEFAWQNYDRNSTTFTATVPGAVPNNFTVMATAIDTYSAFLNGYYDFPSHTKFSPFVGAGLGVTWLDAAVRSGPDGVVRTPGLAQSAFAYQAKAGLSYHVTDTATAFFQYRFTGTAGFHYGGATASVGNQTYAVQPATGNLSNHALELGLRWRL